MAGQTFAIPRVDDASVVAAFVAVVSKFRPQHANATLPGFQQAFSLLNEEHVQVLAKIANTFLIARLNIGYDGFRIDYFRGGEPRGENRPSALFDELKFENIQTQGQPFSDKDRLEVVAKLTESLSAKRVVLASGAIDIQSLDALYQATVLKLETSFASQIEKITNWTVEQAAEIERTKTRLAEESAKHLAGLETTYVEKQTALDAKEVELDERKRKLAARLDRVSDTIYGNRRLGRGGRLVGLGHFQLLESKRRPRGLLGGNLRAETIETIIARL